VIFLTKRFIESPGQKQWTLISQTMRKINPFDFPMIRNQFA
jgi:hypothetical protein